MTTLNYGKMRAQEKSYKTLALLFSTPVDGIHNKADFYDELVENGLLLDHKMLELARKLRSTSKYYDIAELKEEHARLFSGSDKTTALACPCSRSYDNMQSLPNLSEWIDNEYSKVSFTPMNPEIPHDHIISELNFIHTVISKAADHLEKQENDKAGYFSLLRCSFIGEHMLQWVPDFTKSIIFYSKSPYYLQLAILARTMLVNCSGEEGFNS